MLKGSEAEEEAAFERFSETGAGSHAGGECLMSAAAAENGKEVVHKGTALRFKPSNLELDDTLSPLEGEFRHGLALTSLELDNGVAQTEEDVELER